MLVFHGALGQDKFLLWAESNALGVRVQTDEPVKNGKLNSGSIESLSPNELAREFSEEWTEEDIEPSEYAYGTRAESRNGNNSKQNIDEQNTDEEPVDEVSANSFAGEIRKPEPLPFAASLEEIVQALQAGGILLALRPEQNMMALVWTPESNGTPLASTSIIGRSVEDADPDSLRLAPWEIPAICLDIAQLIELLCYCVSEQQLAPGVLIGQDLQFLALAMRFAGTLVAKQQFLPGLRVSSRGAEACWEPVFLGDDGEKLSRLAAAMPGSCLACEIDSFESHEHRASELLAVFLNQVTDYLVRTAEVGRLPPHAESLPESSDDKQARRHA
jgi:hypothetical protein